MASPPHIGIDLQQAAEQGTAPARELVAADETQRAALELYRVGLNVFPIERGTKDRSFGQWRRMQATRLADPLASLNNMERFLRLFQDTNIAVMAGRTSMNLTVLDCESLEVAAMHQAEFVKRGLWPWVNETARGLQFWWLSDCEVKNDPDKQTPPRGWEIRGHSLYVLAYPSVHPTGAVYLWRNRSGERLPAIPIAALDWLALNPRTSRRKDAIPLSDDPLRGLYKKTRDFLLNGASKGTRDNRLFEAACDCAAKMSYAEAYPLLMRGCEISGFDESFSRARAEHTIHSAFSKPRHSYLGEKPTLTATWRKAAAWAQAHQWKRLPWKTEKPRAGRQKVHYVSAQTARAVFLACCERCRRDHADVFRAAEREVAELANTSRLVARRALRAFVSAGYLLDRGHNDIGARLFAFPKGIARYVPSSKEPVNSIGYMTRGEAESDVFRRGALGKPAGRVWDTILQKPLTVEQVRARTGLHPHTIRRALRRLEKHRLARRAGASKWIGDEAEEDRLREIAAHYGTAGQSEVRRAKHARERSDYATDAMLRSKHGRTRRGGA